MNQWTLLLLIFLVWILWAVAGAMATTIQNEDRPKEKRGGFSLVAIIPIFPLFFWGVALLIDRFVAPWGTRVIGGLHAVLAVVIVAYIIHYSRQHRAKE